MATTKKTTTKPKAEVETINEEVIKEIVEEVTVKEAEPVITEPPVKTKKEFTDSDYILCRSVWSGGLNFDSQSGNLYRFNNYGAECEINYRDLVTMIRRGSEHVFLPRFIILDEDFLEDFPTVRRVYGTMYTREDLVEILNRPVSAMKKEIEKLPKTTKDNLRSMVATHIASGKLDSISKVRALTEIFNSDFNLLSDLFIK